MDVGMVAGRRHHPSSTRWKLAAGAVALALAWLIVSPAFVQSSDQVAFRAAGDRVLQKPEDGRARALQDLPFARLSEVAYERAPGIQADRPAACPDPVSSLEQHWKKWPGFPADDSLFHDYHLRVEAWSTPDGVVSDDLANENSRPGIAVAFGGTDAKYIEDWVADFRWFIPFHNDQYTQIIEKVAPQFAETFSRLSARPDWAYIQKAVLYTTGHSLGGGLAQQFAYAVPRAPGVPRVRHVYAFDPSPVTGYYSVRDTALRDENVKTLRIDRIYQRDEVLAGVRTALAIVYPPKKAEPAIEGVRYSLFRGNIVRRHSISQLACRLSDLASGVKPGREP